MDAHRVSSHHSQMDYNNLDSMGPKPGKMSCQEDRFDSGLDSLKEEDLEKSFEEMSVSTVKDLPQEYESWRAAVTDDGDT